MRLPANLYNGPLEIYAGGTGLAQFEDQRFFKAERTVAAVGDDGCILVRGVLCRAHLRAPAGGVLHGHASNS